MLKNKNKAIQDKSRQYKTNQGNTRQIKAIQGNTRQYNRGDILPVIMLFFQDIPSVFMKKPIY